MSMQEGQTRHDGRKPQLRTTRTGARPNSSKPKAGPHSRLLGLVTAEREYGISRWTWMDLIAKGAIPAIRPPGLRRVFLDRHDIETKLEEWKETAQ